METQSFRLISNNLCFGPMPNKFDEVEQHLTVSSNGRVWFSARNYEQYTEGKGFCRKKQLNIGKWKAQFLINIVRNVYVEYDVTDCGYWEMTVREADNRWTSSGPLIGNEIGTTYGSIPIPVTKLVRRYIPVYGLWVFDSNLSPDYEGKKAIYLFSEKWIKILSSEHPQEQVFESSFGEECTALGFQMDCGEEFNKSYPGCFEIHNHKLAQAIADINDVDLLGSVLFSQWRYLTHWAWAYSLDQETRGWFLIVLKRMKELTRKTSDQNKDE